MGLELKPSKTRLTHTLNMYGEEKPGFNFLGYTVRQFPASKHRSAKKTNGEPLSCKTLIRPSKESIKVHTEKLGDVINHFKVAPQWKLIGQLNPIIRGWTNYYSTVVSKITFNKVNHFMYSKLKRWAQRRHPNKTGYWVTSRYWKTIGDSNWEFATTKGCKFSMRLFKHTETPIKRHVKVRGNGSPYNGDWVYWALVF